VVPCVTEGWGGGLARPTDGAGGPRPERGGHGRAAASPRGVGTLWTGEVRQGSQDGADRWGPTTVQGGVGQTV
jgi:hypothetical protein